MRDFIVCIDVDYQNALRAAGFDLGFIYGDVYWIRYCVGSFDSLGYCDTSGKYIASLHPDNGEYPREAFLDTLTDALEYLGVHTDNSEEIETLRQWYLETIGYDPFSEAGASNVDDVRAIKAEYLAERAAQG